jgi:hypothetical protein
MSQTPEFPCYESQLDGYQYHPISMHAQKYCEKSGKQLSGQIFKCAGKRPESCLRYFCSDCCVPNDVLRGATNAKKTKKAKDTNNAENHAVHPLTSKQSSRVIPNCIGKLVLYEKPGKGMGNTVICFMCLGKITITVTRAGTCTMCVEQGSITGPYCYGTYCGPCSAKIDKYESHPILVSRCHVNLERKKLNYMISAAPEFCKVCMSKIDRNKEGWNSHRNVSNSDYFLMNCKGFYCNSPRCQRIAYMFHGEAQPARNQRDQSCPGSEPLKETATSATSASAHPSRNRVNISLTK